MANSTTKTPASVSAPAPALSSATAPGLSPASSPTLPPAVSPAPTTALTRGLSPGFPPASTPTRSPTLSPASAPHSVVYCKLCLSEKPSVATSKLHTCDCVFCTLVGRLRVILFFCIVLHVYISLRCRDGQCFSKAGTARC